MQVGHSDYGRMNNLLAVSFADREFSSAAEQIRLSREREARVSSLNLDEALRKSNEAEKQVHAQQRLAEDANDLLNQIKLNPSSATPVQPESISAFLPAQFSLSPSAQATIFGSKELQNDPSLTPQAQRRARLSQADINDILGRVPSQPVALEEVEDTLPEYDFDMDSQGNLYEPVREQAQPNIESSSEPSTFSPLDTVPDTVMSRAAGLYTANFYNSYGDSPRYSFLG